MNIPINQNLVDICKEIEAQVVRDGKAGLVWSDDEYQRPTIVGGWTPEDQCFWFSFYSADGKDYVFPLSIENVLEIARGGTPPIAGEFWKNSPLW